MSDGQIPNKLLPRSLIDELPEPELKGLGLLAREIADSDIFEIDDEYNIHTMYHDVRVSLHVHESVKRRLKGGDRHLSCSVEFWGDNICILVPGDTPATDDCLVFLLLAKCGWRKDMVPMTLWDPIQQVMGRREEKEEQQRRAEQAEFEYQKKLPDLLRREADLRSREKEDWEWILSHFTTEKGRYIPEYY
jgi:hypothetical protein